MSIIPSPSGACYDYVIGLSRTECDCHDPKTGYELDYNTSYSGLYLDEVHPLNNLTGLENCDNQDVWRIMSLARERAVNTFIADTNALISKYYQLKYRSYTGIIGRVKNDKDYGSYRYLRWYYCKMQPNKKRGDGYTCHRYADELHGDARRHYL